MTIKYIEKREELSWRKIPTIPLINLPLHSSEGYGHIKKWIEENIDNDVYIMVDDKGKEGVGLTGFKIIVKEILIVFSQEADYTAFKIVFPEHC